MQWLVHGTDAGTGQPVTLAVEHPQAAGAVQAAMSKRIVVSYVTGVGRMRWLMLPVICGLLLAIAGGLFYWKHAADMTELRAMQSEKSRLATALAESSASIATLQQRVVTLEQANSGAGREMIDQLEAARQRTAAAEKDLAAARLRMADLERTASKADGLQKEAAAAKAEVSKLEKQLSDQAARVRELDSQAKAAAKLAKTNKDLAAELDSLKSQLLLQAAKTEIPAITTAEPADTSGRTTHWALRMDYASASDFLALKFTGQETATTPGADGTLVTTAVWPENAATIRLVHNGARNRLYSATLTASLAADAPKEKLAENMRLVQAFVQTFSPGVPENWAADAVKQLAAKEPAERLVRVGDDYRLSAWNNGQGGYSWRIESPRGEVE